MKSSWKFNPIVRKGQKCSWKNHAVRGSALYEVVGYCEKKASQDKQHRLFWAKEKRIAEATDCRPLQEKKNNPDDKRPANLSTVWHQITFMRNRLGILTDRFEWECWDGEIRNVALLSEHDDCCERQGGRCVMVRFPFLDVPDPDTVFETQLGNELALDSAIIRSTLAVDSQWTRSTLGNELGNPFSSKGLSGKGLLDSKNENGDHPSEPLEPGEPGEPAAVRRTGGAHSLSNSKSTPLAPLAAGNGKPSDDHRDFSELRNLVDSNHNRKAKSSQGATVPVTPAPPPASNGNEELKPPPKQSPQNGRPYNLKMRKGLIATIAAQSDSLADWLNPANTKPWATPAHRQIYIHLITHAQKFVGYPFEFNDPEISVTFAEQLAYTVEEFEKDVTDGSMRMSVLLSKVIDRVSQSDSCWVYPPSFQKYRNKLAAQERNAAGETSVI